MSCAARICWPPATPLIRILQLVASAHYHHILTMLAFASAQPGFCMDPSLITCTAQHPGTLLMAAKLEQHSQLLILEEELQKGVNTTRAPREHHESIRHLMKLQRLSLEPLIQAVLAAATSGLERCLHMRPSVRRRQERNTSTSTLAQSLAHSYSGVVKTYRTRSTGCSSRCCLQLIILRNLKLLNSLRHKCETCPLTLSCRHKKSQGQAHRAGSSRQKPRGLHGACKFAMWLDCQPWCHLHYPACTQQV